MTFFNKNLIMEIFQTYTKTETRATSPQLTTLSADSSQFLPVFYDLCPFLGECCYRVAWSPSPPEYTQANPGPCGCDLI